MMAGKNRQIGFIWPKGVPAGTGCNCIRRCLLEDFSFRHKLSFTSFGICGKGSRFAYFELKAFHLNCLLPMAFVISNKFRPYDIRDREKVKRCLKYPGCKSPCDMHNGISFDER